MSRRGHVQQGGTGGCPSAQWRPAPSARQKGEKKGKNSGVGSYYAQADGGKGINRSCLLPLARRDYLGRQEGWDGRDRQEGWQMVGLAEGSGWLVRRRSEGLCGAQDGVPGLLGKSAVRVLFPPSRA